MSFDTWIDTFISEKGIDTDHILKPEGPSGVNIIPLCILIDVLKDAAPKHEQEAIKAHIVKLDFHSAPVLPYFEHLAKAIAM